MCTVHIHFFRDMYVHEVQFIKTDIIFVTSFFAIKFKYHFIHTFLLLSGSSISSNFSSPEPKAHGELIVYRSIRRPSVCASVRKHFQT